LEAIIKEKGPVMNMKSFINDLLDPDILPLNRGRLRNRNIKNDALIGVRIIKLLNLPKFLMAGGI
jgi:hypothetical protein